MKKNQRKKADFPYHVDNFLLKYMPARNLSLNTINSYGDTLLLFMEYIELKHSISRDNLCMTDITPELVDDFIQWLEQDRNCSQATCNNRLAAIKSFAKYVSKKDVKYVYTAQQIKALEAKETPFITHALGQRLHHTGLRDFHPAVRGIALYRHGGRNYPGPECR